MELTLTRIEKESTYTIGKLYNGDTFLCDTLEDRYRGLKDTWELATILAIKIKHETAIPEGRYEVDITFSNRFQKPLPLLKNVKGFDGIRIHSGNRSDQTDGCILVGEHILGDEINNSRREFQKVFKLIGEALLNEQVFITIQGH